MQWQTLPDQPFKDSTKPAIVTDCEYMIMSDTNQLAEYNTLRNEWSSLSHKSSIFKESAETITCRKDSNTLYITDIDRRLIAFEQKKGSTVTLCKYLGVDPELTLMIGGDLHVFGELIGAENGETGLGHLVMNEQNGYSGSIFDVDLVTDQISTITGAVVHSDGRDSIILFGINYSNKEGCKPIFAEYSLSTKRWNIWRYPSIDKEVKRHTGMVCTADGRYLITLGGMTHCDFPGRTSDAKEEDLDMVIVYDLEDHAATPMVSAIRCPVKGKVDSLMMTDLKRDELLTFGFIRRCFKSQEMREIQLMPIYLLRAVAKWVVEMEWVHLLEREGKGHWRMRVDDILKSIH